MALTETHREPPHRLTKDLRPNSQTHCESDSRNREPS
ncbi:uncharacterized protein FFM5_04893 [Fusarium fujikuroi]|nr:uncharacterized protein FFM5_04893 [Fusarium fujikuroi]